MPTPEEANTARAVAVIPVVSEISPSYVELCLREDGMRNRLALASHEVARKTLNLEDVRPARIAFAPISEQAEIVAQVEAKLSNIAQAETEINARSNAPRACFLLKGALLFSLWFDSPHRPTRDADFLGFGTPDAERIAFIVRQVCAIECDDGISYEAVSVRVEPIREEAAYDGLRASLRATLGNARCTVQLDVGFGDTVTPGPVEVEYFSLLEDIRAGRARPAWVVGLNIPK